MRVLDVSLGTLLCAVLLQLVPLPAAVVRVLSPAREAYLTATALRQAGQGGLAPLSLDVASTMHAWLSLFIIVMTFWIARTLFARGGIRTFSMAMAWGAIVFALIAFAQHASGTTLVYGFWPPRDLGARPLGPFINRNHFGTWCILAICLCAGYLQWRIERFQGGGSWRARVASLLDGRGVVLHLAVALLAVAVALTASRSSLVALACAAGYVALAAPAGPQGGRRRAVAGDHCGRRDHRDARIRRRTTAASSHGRDTNGGDDEPDRDLARRDGRGAGFSADRRRRRRVQYGDARLPDVAADLLSQRDAQPVPPADRGRRAAPVSASRGGAPGVCRAAWRQLRSPEDPLQWMRVAAAAALIGVAVQSIWETGLTVPANGMFAAALAGLLVHTATHSPYVVASARGAALTNAQAGFDVDGVLADFRSSFRSLAMKELGHAGGDVEAELSKGDIERLWKAVARAPNWWADLPAYEPVQIARLYEISRQGRWEVFFMTSRPPSGGDTVQLQTQVWLERTASTCRRS